MDRFDKLYGNMRTIVLRIDKYILNKLSKTKYNDLSMSEIAIIDTIGKNNEKTISEIAKLLEISLSTPTRAMDRLVNKGYIVRETSTKDRRVVLSTLTSSGQEVADTLVEYRRFLFSKYFQRINSKDFKIFQEILDELVKIEI